MKNRVAISYFFIHGLLEFVCFGYLFTFFANKSLPWLIALSYDFIAFMPQGIIGDLHHRLRKLPLGSIGFVLVLSSLLTSTRQIRICALSDKPSMSVRMMDIVSSDVGEYITGNE